MDESLVTLTDESAEDRHRFNTVIDSASSCGGQQGKAALEEEEEEKRATPAAAHTPVRGHKQDKS